MSEDLVEIRHITKIFNSNQPPALKDINVNISKGKIVGLAGPDGAGKTTLIRLMAGLLKPTEGTITIDGYDTIKNASQIPFLIGYMPQRFGLYEDLTVIQNLNLYADLQGTQGSERQKIFQNLLKFTGLEPFTNRLAGALSGGMKQKLGLACTLIRTPALLLLDEPSVGVDPLSRRELWKMVQDLRKEGISIIWSTAYLDEAEKCDEVMLLNEGKLLYYGLLKQITERVSGRTFKISNIEGSRRSLLRNALVDENVIDGVIQGADVRIVVKEKKDPPLAGDKLNGGGHIKLTPVAPRFEDAFIDILGGGPGGGSVLADITPQMTNKEEIVVEAQGLTKQFGSFVAVNDVSFNIKQGEIFGLLGPNGAGKSTLFKMMCGLLQPTSGKAYVNGLDLQNAPSEGRAHIGYMAQKFSLYGDLSVLQNLDFFSGIYNLTGSHQQKVIKKMVEIFNFKAYENESANELPLGFKQRLALSCAVMHQPGVIFLDEPTSGVDPITRREFWNHINGLVEKGVTVLVTTHFMDEAEYCDRIALVYRGHVIKMGTPDALKEAATSIELPSPTLEDAFIKLIERYDENGLRSKN